MTFFERYAAIMDQYNIVPSGQRAAEMFGITKATISSWNTKGITPKGDTVAVIADKLGVSADYLLGRTEDPTDYTKEDNGTPKPIAFPGPKIPDKKESFMKLYDELDDDDKIKAEGVLMGMLMANKYHMVGQEDLLAAHERTDVKTDKKAKAHDLEIMGDENF